jgi:2-polyprenyl-3-methyl-5-hydroxy-6-metoxy-1,4-benzoquinol methylase
MVHHNECPLCSSDKISFFLRCRDHLFSKEDFNLFKCSTCDFVFTQDHPGEQDIGKYYESDDYISHDDKAKGFSNRIYLLVRDKMLNKKRKIVERATALKGANLLDIGSGTGYFAGTMKKAGWKVTGIEPNKKASDYGAARFSLEMVRPEQISELPDNSFNCITMWHVLEHFQEPFKYAIEIKRLLKPDGLCIAALPNNNSFDSAYYGILWAAYDVPRHLWHFNPSTFKLFSEKAGFRIVEIINLPLDVFYISILGEKNKGSKLPFIMGLIMGAWFALKSAKRKNKSSSLIYILRKSID